MKLGCMILYHPTITSQSKIRLIEKLFPQESVEIQVKENNTVILYVSNIKKEQVWQAVSELVTAEIVCGYGFGWRRKDAKREADNLLQKWIEMDANAIRY
ncbi:hypothetical protein NSQ77_04690 [Oceanobacillus sp. FSL K6-2867]|uniref:hypothetical protein n=1 Tax=Oceanobacillus sp. FSL K6-2867 TaxID=2954748 RepID=UPI0030DD4AD8